MRIQQTTGAPTVPGRNDPCPCGSGLKAKRCHMLAWSRIPAGVPAIVGGAARPASAGWDGHAYDAESERLGVWLDAGYGDAIHALRYVRGHCYHRGTGPDPFVVCRRSLARLFRHSFPHMEIHDATPVPRQTIGVSCLGLIKHAANNGWHGEWRTPYLRAPKPMPRPADGLLHAGLCLRGDPSQPFDKWRSVHDPADAAPLALVPGVAWHSLALADLAAAGARDWADTANLVAGLDLVVAVDTGVAHLAGALGTELWLLDRAPGPGDPGPDDRWEPGVLQPGPLYPEARTFRQRARGQWREAVGRVAEALRCAAGT